MTAETPHLDRAPNGATLYRTRAGTTYTLTPPGGDVTLDTIDKCIAWARSKTLRTDVDDLLDLRLTHAQDAA